MSATLHGSDTLFSRRHAPTWILLTFAAGTVNAGAFLACERFVSHVTGMVVSLGIDAHGWELVAESGLLLVFFLLGSMASVLAIGGRYYRGLRPLYALPLVVVAAILSFVALAGRAGWLGPFGGSAHRGIDLALLCILAFAMGLQNAAVTTTTGAAVRSTHMTGPATDLGIYLATSAFTHGDVRATALRHAALRAGKIAAFIAGCAAMVPITHAVGFLAFLVPAALVLAATALSFVPTWSDLAVPRPPRSAALPQSP